MDQPEVGLGQGRGRGRGSILKQAIDDATSTNRVTSETNTGKMPNIQEQNQSTISDEDIKKWLKQELAKRTGGIWVKHFSDIFSKNFEVNAPDDLISKIKGWSPTFEIDSIAGGEVIQLSHEVLVEQRGNAAESKPNVPTVPDKFIQIWLKKELSKRQSGIGMTDIPSLFKENFNAPAPEDLITKTRSWTNLVQIQSIQGRDVITLTPKISPTRDRTSPQDEDTQATKESTSDNKAVSKSVCIPEKGSFLDVHVKWSASPSYFCCIPYNHNLKLNSMMEELNACLKAKSETMLKATLVPGDVYAGYYLGRWFRVIFKGHSDDNMVMAYVADYCLDVKLNMDKVQELPNRFHSLPFGSFKAGLQGVAPADRSSQWSEQAMESFGTITHERDFVCLICDGADNNGMVSVKLVDTASEEDEVVDEILEELGLAVRTW